MDYVKITKTQLIAHVSKMQVLGKLPVVYCAHAAYTLDKRMYRARLDTWKDLTLDGMSIQWHNRAIRNYYNNNSLRMWFYLPVGEMETIRKEYHEYMAKNA